MKKSRDYDRLISSSAKEIISHLGLAPLPEEGGHFVQSYKSKQKCKIAGKTNGPVRSCGTGIFYLISSTEFSLLHRLRFDETYHFYAGDPVNLVQISKTGRLTKTTLGHSITSGQAIQAVIPAGTWQGSHILQSKIGWSLLGTTMAPGFEFEDFELADRKKLINAWPEHKNLIRRLTKA